MATFYVDADDAARSDAWTRVQAADDPTKPFATMQACALLLEAGDTLQVEPSTLGNADPTNLLDPDMYDGVHHLAEIDGSDVLPTADNSAGAPILVVGHIVGDVLPKVRRLDFAGLKNWQFSNLQKGYDRGSGNDHDFVGGLRSCGDLRFENIQCNGGAWYCQGSSGLMEFVGCSTYSPYSGGGSFLHGVGFKLLGYDTSSGDAFTHTYRFTDCHWEDVGGEDCIQSSLGTETGTEGYLEVIGCTFQDIIQSGVPGAPHTDCIQGLGGAGITIVDCRFFNCNTPLLASDGHHLRISFIGNLLDECTAGCWGQGTDEWVVMNNTILTSSFGIAIGDRMNESDPTFTQKVTLVNNLTLSIDFAAGVVIAGDSVVVNNILTGEPGRVTDWGTQLEGVPELGASPRLVSAGLDGNYELANTPTDSVGIGDGRDLTGLDLTVAEIAFLADDHLGRAYGSPRDVGAFQSDPGTAVSPAPRAPYVFDKLPLGNGAALDADATCRLFARPGVTVDETTVTASTAYVTDAAGEVIPGVVSLAEPDEDGYQALTIDMKIELDPLTDGDLFPLVNYTAHLTAAIEDSEGSAIAATSWDFRAVGPDGPAIGVPGASTSQPSFTLEADPRFHVGETIYLFHGAGLVPISPTPVTSAVVAADSTTTFEGLEAGTPYLAGFSVAGPFISFKT